MVDRLVGSVVDWLVAFVGRLVGWLASVSKFNRVLDRIYIACPHLHINGIFNANVDPTKKGYCAKVHLSFGDNMTSF